MNQSLLENKRLPTSFFVINGITCGIFGSVFLYTVGFVRYLAVEYKRPITN